MDTSTVETQGKTGEEAGPVWSETAVTVALKDGSQMVPAMVHPWCPGLAVTSAHFGLFAVTHLASGNALGGVYERAGNAAVEMTEWAAIAFANGWTWDLGADEVVRAVHSIGDQPVPFEGATATSKDGVRPLTVREWVGIVRGNTGADDEFPWEEESPWYRAEQNIELLAPASLSTGDTEGETQEVAA